MPSDIGDILANKSLPQEPEEFVIIRRFVQEKFSTTPSLKIQDNDIIIGVPGSAFAGSLRLALPELENKLNSKKRLIIRSL